MNKLISNKARELRRAIVCSVAFALLLWSIKILEQLFNVDLTQYGIYPRSVQGLQGIAWAPLIHGSWSHLLANTGPVVLLGAALLYGYPKSAKRMLPIIYIGVGSFVWMFARESYHIGASGLTFGMMFFVFTIGFIRGDKQAIVLSLVVLLLYGGMLGNLLSDDPGISFESHLAGGLLGFMLAIIFRHTDPPPPAKKYSWDEDDDQEEFFEGEWELNDERTPDEKHTIH